MAVVVRNHPVQTDVHTLSRVELITWTHGGRGPFSDNLFHIFLTKVLLATHCFFLVKKDKNKIQQQQKTELDGSEENHVDFHQRPAPFPLWSVQSETLQLCSRERVLFFKKKKKKTPRIFKDDQKWGVE
jgi:hypothetical protein